MARIGATRTHTHFWSDEQMAGLENEVESLAADWTDRRGHCDPALQQAGDARVLLLRTAVRLAREAAD